MTDKLKLVWLVGADGYALDDDTCIMAAFTEYRYAVSAFEYGKEKVPSLHWTLVYAALDETYDFVETVNDVAKYFNDNLETPDITGE